MFLIHLFVMVANASNPVERNIDYLRRQVKKGNCTKYSISSKVDSYVEKYIDNPLVWALRAEADTCLKKDLQTVYLSYEKFLELGGKKSDVKDDMTKLESELYQAEITIRSEDGSKIDWSKVDVSLPSDRFVQESEGTYLLQYTTSQRYELAIKSSDPSIESKTITLEGKGSEKIDVSLKIYQFAELTIPEFDKSISLRLYPSNNPKKGEKGRRGTKTITTGPLEIQASYKNKTIDYTTEITSGQHILTLPWGYILQYNDTTLATEFFEPTQDFGTFTLDPIPFDIAPLELSSLTYQITKEPGFVRTIDIQKAFEESDLSNQLSIHNKLLRKHDEAKTRAQSAKILTGVTFVVGGLLQGLAIESNDSSLRSTSNTLLGAGVILLVYTFDINKSSNSKIKKEMKKSEEKLEELKQQPILIR